MAEINTAFPHGRFVTGGCPVETTRFGHRWKPRRNGSNMQRLVTDGKQIGKPPERGRVPSKAALNIVTGGIGTCRNRLTVIDFSCAAVLK